MRRLVATVAALTIGGCSFFATTTPKGQSRTRMDGAYARSAVFVDAAVVLGAVAWDIRARLCKPTGSDLSTCGFEAVTGIGFSIAALPALAGAIYGATRPSCSSS